MRGASRVAGPVLVLAACGHLPHHPRLFPYSRALGEEELDPLGRGRLFVLMQGGLRERTLSRRWAVIIFGLRAR